MFRDKMEEIVSECVPKRRRRKANRPPWLTQEVLRAIRKKKRLWARDKNRQDKAEYKAQEKLTRNLIRKAKKKFERRLADGGGQNKRPFYAYVRNRTKETVGRAIEKRRRSESSGQPGNSHPSQHNIWVGIYEGRYHQCARTRTLQWSRNQPVQTNSERGQTENQKVKKIGGGQTRWHWPLHHY
jgi:hypothetical protein